MRIAILADQHGTLPEIPECDLLILSGDLTGGNPHGPRDNSDVRWKSWLINDFSKWVCDGLARHGNRNLAIAIAGNHDTALEAMGPYAGGMIQGVSYLLDAGVNRDNYPFIWGTPWIRHWDGLAFNLKEAELRFKWYDIPNDTDILVCHQPPKGYGDGAGLGCPHLTQRILQVKPKLVTCGHIHEGRGIYDLDGTMVVNASGAFTVVEI